MAGHGYIIKTLSLNMGGYSIALDFVKYHKGKDAIEHATDRSLLL